MRTNIRDICIIPSKITDGEIVEYLRSKLRTPNASDVARMNTRLKKILQKIQRRKRPDWNRLRYFFFH
jgi:hypothetical protein